MTAILLGVDTGGTYTDAVLIRGEAVLANGTLTATIEQPCAVTRENIRYAVTEPLALRFVPAESMPDYAPDEEVELDTEDLDEIPYEGDVFDLGEAILNAQALRQQMLGPFDVAVEVELQLQPVVEILDHLDQRRRQGVERLGGEVEARAHPLRQGHGQNHDAEQQRG